MAAAGALFAAKGIEAVTMAQIAERAGLQQSSIYYWFRSKAEILGSILERVNRIPLAIVERERAAPGPVAVRLYRLVREDVLALCGFPFDINEIHRLAVRSPDDFDAYWDERRQLDVEVEALIAEGVASGELRRVDARLAARTLLAGDEATQNWFRGRGVLVLRGRRRRVARRRGRGAIAAGRSVDLRRGARRGNIVSSDPGSELARCPPAVALGGEGRLLRRAEGVDARGVRGEERLVVGEAERRRLDGELQLARGGAARGGRAGRRHSPGGTGVWSKLRSSQGTSGSAPGVWPSRYHTGTVRPTNW